MDPRRLLIFRTVVRNGSIGAGARELGWTQPAVSQHLKVLREAGVIPDDEARPYSALAAGLGKLTKK